MRSIAFPPMILQLDKGGHHGRLSEAKHVISIHQIQVLRKYEAGDGGRGGPLYNAGGA